MKLALGLITATVIALTAGCASTGSTSPTATQPPPSHAPFAGAGPTASVATDTPQASSEPSSDVDTGPCVTKACIIADAKSLVGGVAKDDSVMTKMTCRKSTVKQPTPGVYTVHCTATYSDDTVYAGIASVLVNKSRVTWEVTEAISD